MSQGVCQQDQCLFAAILPASQEQGEERAQVCQTCALHVGIHHMIESVELNLWLKYLVFDALTLGLK